MQKKLICELFALDWVIDSEETSSSRQVIIAAVFGDRQRKLIDCLLKKNSDGDERVDQLIFVD